MTAKFPNAKALVGRKQVRFMVSSWDAWVANETDDFGVDTSMIDPATPTSVLTRYGYRQSCFSDGTNAGWYLYGGVNATEQARYDDQLVMMHAAGLIRFMLLYPDPAATSSGSPTISSDIFRAGRDRHFASPNKYSVPLCYVIQDGNQHYDANTPKTWLNEAAYCASIVADIQDSVYVKITANGVSNRPILGIYSDGVAPVWDSTHLATLTTAVTNAGFGTPLYIEMRADTTESNTLNLNYLTSYGPAGTTPTTSGHRPWSDLYAKCQTVDVLAGLNAKRCFTMVHCLDNRPRGASTWTDTPVYTEFEQAILDRYISAQTNYQLNPDHLIHMYSVNEVDEGGDFFPTLQSRVRGAPYGGATSYGIYLDALINVRNKTLPSTYDDHYHAYSVHANVGSIPAGWALTQDLTGASGATTGAWQYQELQNSTTTNARTWTVTGTRIRVYGGKRVGLGHISFSLDGAAAIDVDQGSLVGTGYNQLLYDSGTISNASHTLAIARVSGTVGFDEVVVSISR